MKKYILQTVTDTGELVDESALELSEGSILIVRPKVELSPETLGFIHEMVLGYLQDERGLLTIPDFVELKVLDIKE